MEQCFPNSLHNTTGDERSVPDRPLSAAILLHPFLRFDLVSSAFFKFPRLEDVSPAASGRLCSSIWVIHRRLSVLPEPTLYARQGVRIFETGGLHNGAFIHSSLGNRSSALWW